VIGTAYWMLVARDIDAGGGIITVTLRSGVQLVGRLDRELSKPANGLKLNTLDGGYHVINFAQIAAMTGRFIGDGG